MAAQPIDIDDLFEKSLTEEALLENVTDTIRSLEKQLQTQEDLLEQCESHADELDQRLAEYDTCFTADQVLVLQQAIVKSMRAKHPEQVSEVTSKEMADEPPPPPMGFSQ